MTIIDHDEPHQTADTSQDAHQAVPDPVTAKSSQSLDQGKKPVKKNYLRIDHLYTVIDQVPIGLLLFTNKLETIFVNDHLAFLLSLPLPKARACTTVADLFVASRLIPLEALRLLQLRPPAQLQRLIDKPIPLFVTVKSLAKDVNLAIIQTSIDHNKNHKSHEDKSSIDPLTGLFSRTGFEKLLDDALTAYASMISAQQTTSVSKHYHPVTNDQVITVIIADLDRFKEVNDGLGHAISDALLRLVAKRVKTSLRHADVVARLAEDEFAILIRANETQACALAQRTINLINRPYLIRGHHISVGATIGIAVGPRDGKNAADLMRSADLALHNAKRETRGKYQCFLPDLDAKAIERRSLEVDLRKALSAGEFDLHYQPQIRTDNNKLVGFEALLRWYHPERGLVPPVVFIPIAEEIGLIVAIGEWVMRKACHTAVTWPDNLSVAVNVSPYQFDESETLVDVVKTALKQSSLPASRLEIEITETMLLTNQKKVLSALKALRQLGVRVAMDDFGTGYSSLSQLQTFPFDAIKIDRSFITALDNQIEGNAIVRAITALASALGMTAIAEGVETSYQLERLREEGCGLAQGYLFSHPVPAAQVLKIIDQFSVE